MAAARSRGRIAAELACVFVLALAVRGLYLHQLRGTLPLATLVGDGRAYDAWAARIAAGDWLGSEVFYQAPLYPYLLGVLYTVAGHDPALVRLAQVVLGACSCLLLYWAGNRWLGPPVGLIAGLMLALYPPAIFFDALVQKAVLDLLLVTLLLALVAEAQARRGWPWLLATGGALGALALNRENARVLYPVLVGWVWFCFRELPALRRCGWIGLLTAGAALVLLPVGFRNYYVGGEFLLSTSQLGPNFYIGNHPGASGRYEPLVPRRGDPRFEQADAKRLAEEAVGKKLSPREVSRYWLDRSLDFIRNQPGAWLRLLGRKTMLVFHAREVVDSEAIEVYAEHSWLLRALLPVWHLGVVLPLAMLGVWLTRGRWRELAVLYSMFVVLAGSTALFYVFARYRFSLVPFPLLFAAAAVGQLPRLVEDVRRRLWIRRWGPGLLLAALVAVVCNYPLAASREDAVTYMNLAAGLMADGKPGDAVEPLERAIGIQPELPGAHHNLGLALLALQRADEAARQFEEALRYAPDYGDAHASLAQYYADRGRPDLAILHFRQAIANVAEPALLHVELGELLFARGDSSGAVAEFRAALHADANLPIALNNLAWILATDPDARIRDGAAAVLLAERLVRGPAGSTSGKPSPAAQAGQLDTLGAAYAEVGRFDDALSAVEKGLSLAKSARDEELAAVLQSRVELYRAHRPYRSPQQSAASDGR